ncbi:MAG: pitrilysin family protein [Planctomycetota bacterium]|nr:pitrilysin family protein [Planctomycetota bacterium]
MPETTTSETSAARPGGASAGSALDTILPDGLRVVGERIERSEGVALAIRIPAGTKDDPANKLGLANLVQETLFKGTRKHDARALSDAFDFYGIHHGNHIGTETTQVWLGFLPEYTANALSLLREVVSQPSFPQKDCETAKVQAIQELKRLDDEPLTKVFVLLKELYFGTAWGHPEMGSETTVPDITRSDIEAFWKAQYIPAGATVAVAGKFDPQALQKDLETLVANQGTAWPQENPPPPPDKPVRQHVYKDSEQTQIAMAFPAVPRNDPAYYVLRMAIRILAGGMSGRLFTEVREKRGLVYSVGAQTISLRGSGVVYVYAGTTTPRAAETLQVLKAELARLGQDATQEELERAKIGLKAHLLMDQESTSHRARQLLDDVYYESRAVPVAEIVQKINAVTVDDVKRYWTTHPFEPYALVMLGREALE